MSQATHKQMAFLKKLFTERSTNESAAALREGLLVAYKAGQLTVKMASASIDLLLNDEAFKPIRAAAPERTYEAEIAAEVPDGRYAIASTGDNDLVFYRVSSSAKWGKSVQMIVGGHLDTFVSRRNVPGILHRIATDSYDRPEQHDHDEQGAYTIPAGQYTGPEGAALRFADEIKSCSRCNRTLTDRQSRLDGIGPVCITK